MNRRILALTVLALLLLVPACSREAKLPTAMSPDEGLSTLAAGAGRAGTGLTELYTFAGNLSTGAFQDYTRIDPVTGKGTVLWSLGLDFNDPKGYPTPLGLTYDLDGTLYTIVDWLTFDCPTSTSQLARVDERTGALSYFGPLHPLHFSGPEIGPDGSLWAVGFEKPDQFTGAPFFCGDGWLYRFDKRTGEATRVGATGITADAVMDLAFDSKGGLWATTANKLFRIDTGSGAGTFVCDIAGIPQDHPPMEVMTIAFNARDVLYGTAIIGFCTDYCGPAPVVRIDPVSGQATVIGDTGLPFNHGGDTKPQSVKVCHRTGNGTYVSIEVSIAALEAHRAHGDIVPGVDIEGCDCPAGMAVAVTKN